MKLSVENVSSSTKVELIEFLKRYENTAMFLLGNLESYGYQRTAAPYSGNFKLIRSSDNIVGAFCLTVSGNLLVVSEMKEPVFDLIFQACEEEKIPLKGVIGEWEFCYCYWEFLKLKKVIRREIFASREMLYTADLTTHVCKPQPQVRFLRASDYVAWRQLYLDYLAEQGFPNDLTEEQMHQEFLRKVENKIVWGLFLENDVLVSKAELNARALDLGQVGGVFTRPDYRRRGLAKSLMHQIMCDARKKHVIRKLIIFTEEKNLNACHLYESLGVQHVGYFSILFGE